MSAVDAEKKQQDYRFTNQLKTAVYSAPKGTKGRKVVARLFMGEWSKKLGEEVRGAPHPIPGRQRVCPQGELRRGTHNGAVLHRRGAG